MRNSQAQRYARWSATVAVLLAVVVAGVYLRGVWVARLAARKAPPSVPAAVEQRSNEFSFSKVEGQRTLYTVRASHTTEFKEGSRNLLEDVSISVFGKKGERNDTLRTRACDFISTTGKIVCEGEVQISLQAAGPAVPSVRAIQVVTSGVSFDRNSGLARTEKPVKFRWPAGDGRAVGVQYDSNAGTLRMDRDVELNLGSAKSGTVAVPPEKALHVTGDSMLFRREERTVQVLGSVRATQTTRELNADSLLLNLDDEFHVQHLVAAGHPRITDIDTQGPIKLDADEISAEMTPEGSVESILATGNVHGSRNSSSGDDAIEAGRLQISLATRQNMPRLLTASGKVALTSRVVAANTGTRRVESDALEVHFSSKSKPGLVLVESVNTLAPGRIEWRNTAMANGKPASQTMRMRGDLMSLQFAGQNLIQQLVSSGGVEVTRKLGDEPELTTTSRELTAKFSNTGDWSTIDQTGDVRIHDGVRLGQGDRGHADRATNTVTLDGSVVLSDGTTRTTAQSAVFTEGSNELRADGNVQSIDLNNGSGSAANLASGPAHVSAAHLVADVSKGHAVYSGGGRLWQGDSLIEADTVELDNPSHVIVARGHMRGVFPKATWNPKRQSGSRPNHQATELWHVRGGMLTYWGQEARARVEQDATADSPEGSIHSKQMDLYFTPAGPGGSAQQLSKAVATGDVTVSQEGRRGTSNKAEYMASEGKFVLSEGKPTLYDSNGDTTSGRQLTFFFSDDRIVVDSEEGLRTITLHRVEK